MQHSSPVPRALAVLVVALSWMLSALAGQSDLECPAVDAEANLEALGIELPEPFTPIASFVPAVRAGQLLYLSGNGPQEADGTFITGKVPGQISVEEAQEAARLTAINQLAVIRAELGTLNRVKRIVKLFGMVNSAPDFTAQPVVINGASDLFVAVFGECGKHARSAVGMASLPFGIPVEIDMVIEVRHDDDDDEEEDG